MAGTWDNGSPTDGNDVYTGDASADTVHGGTGNDTLGGAGGSDTIAGGGGADSIDGGGGNDTIYGGASPTDGDPVPFDLSDFGTTTNTAGTAPQYRNNLFGERVAFHSDSATGNETIRYNPITVVAGSNYDFTFLMRENGGDVANYFGRVNIYDGNGNLLTSWSSNVNNGQSFSPTLNFDATTDEIVVEVTMNYLSGNTASSGGWFSDVSLAPTAIPPDGADIISGGDGNDLIYGDAGNDTLSGDAGADTIHGGTGDDQITVGANDQAYGDDDQDTFVLDFTGAPDGSSTTITGGEGGVDLDQIDLNGYTIVPGTLTAAEIAAEAGEFDVTDGVNTYTVNFSEVEIVCFARGTLIKTQKGEQRIEDLRQGDMVLTMDHGYQPIRWIGARKLGATALAANDRLKPIRIRAGALGPNQPEQDLLVSPQHRVLVRSVIAERMFGTSEVLIAAKKLLVLNGVDIETWCTDVEYFHMLFDQHQIVFSNGALTESMFTGPEALKAVSPEAREEILTLFPQLASPDCIATSARLIPEKGRMAKSLVARHAKNQLAVCD